jgi:predicted Zn-dependent protease with MMP-like domain
VRRPARRAASAAGSPDTRPPRRRDRHGRGLRGRLAPAGVPLNRTRSETFDDLVLDAVEEIEQQWAAELAPVEFAVEDVPPPGDELTFDHDVVVDRGVPLGRLFRGGLPEIPQPVIVVYRRPIEARATDPDDRSDLVFMVVVDLAAEFLGKDVDDIDPPR